MTDILAVPEHDLLLALAAASYVTPAQRAALDALPQWRRDDQPGPSGAHRVAAQKAPAPPAAAGPAPGASGEPQVQFMAAQVAPTFSAFDDDDELLAQLPLDPTPGTTPAAAPRRVASQQQQAGGSQRAPLASPQQVSTQTAALTQVLPQTQAPYSSQPAEVEATPGTQPVTAAPVDAAPAAPRVVEAAAKEAKAAPPPTKKTGKVKKGADKQKATKNAKKGTAVAKEQPPPPPPVAAPAPPPASVPVRYTATPDVAAAVTATAEQQKQMPVIRGSSILPATQAPHPRSPVVPPSAAPVARTAAGASPVVQTALVVATSPAPNAAASKGKFALLAALGMDSDAEVRNLVKKQRL